MEDTPQESYLGGIAQCRGQLETGIEGTRDNIVNGLEHLGHAGSVSNVSRLSTLSKLPVVEIKKFIIAERADSVPQQSLSEAGFEYRVPSRTGL